MLLTCVLASEDIRHLYSIGFWSGFSRGSLMEKSESSSNITFCVLFVRYWVEVDAFDIEHKSFCTILHYQIFLFTN